MALDPGTEAAILDAGLALIPKVIELIANAKAAKAEEHAAILARLQAADAALTVDARNARALFEKETQETRAELHGGAAQGALDAATLAQLTATPPDDKK